MTEAPAAPEVGVCGRLTFTEEGSENLKGDVYQSLRAVRVAEKHLHPISAALQLLTASAADAQAEQKEVCSACQQDASLMPDLCVQLDEGRL